MPLHRPRRIFGSSLPRPSRGRRSVAGIGFGGHAGKAVIVLVFLGLATFVTAGAMLVSTSSNYPSGSRSIADRVMAPASDIAVLDGGTLRLANLVVRLRGVEAPSRICPASGAGSAADCGTASAAALAAMVRGRQVTCDILDSDAQGRPLAICSSVGAGETTELNRALVAGGWAKASLPPRPEFSGRP